MSERTGIGAIAATTMSARTLKLRARAPRVLLYGFVTIMCLAGLRATVAPPPPPVVAARAERQTDDIAAQSFAEGFARVYLSWDARRPDLRERRLATMVPSSLERDAGLEPADKTDQDVTWTAVAGVQRAGERTTVTIAAQTTTGLVHLSVPIGRDDRGFLYVAGYPAVVGPPATNRAPEPRTEDEVDDAALVAVAERAVTNYLARAQENLLADLTPDAVVSLPAEALEVTGVGDVNWVRPGRRLAVELDASDERENSWTLRYELEVLKRDRWYVRSLQVDPTFERG